MRIGISLALILAAAVALHVTVLADGKRDCTTAPQKLWQPRIAAEDVARAAGYDVRQSRTDGACYGIVGVKDGRQFGLLYDPANLALVRLTAK
jgi:hypothetical protein